MYCRIAAGGVSSPWSGWGAASIASNLVAAALAGGGLLDFAVADASGKVHVLLSRRE